MDSGFQAFLPLSRRSTNQVKHQSGANGLDEPDSTIPVRYAGAPLCRALRFQKSPIEEDAAKITVTDSSITPHHVTITSGSTASIQLPDKATTDTFTRLDLLITLFSILLYLADIGLDCFVAYKHYLTINDYPLYFGFTVAFIILSALVTSVFSLWWYYCEYKAKQGQETSGPNQNEKSEPSTGLMVVRITGSVLLFGPVLRNIDTIRFGLLSKDTTKNRRLRDFYFSEMKYERVDGAMLRLFEAFLEAGPQVILQLFITFREGLDGEKERNYFLIVITMISILVSMLSLTYSIVAYHKELRRSRDDRHNIRIPGLVLRFVWRLFEVNPRIIAMAMFMSVYTYYLGVFMGIHFVLMLIWIWNLKTGFCETRKCEPMFVFVMALIWSFCFLNIKDGRTRKRSLVFYSLFYTENVILVLFWAVHDDTQNRWYRHIAASVVLGSILPMVISMLIYYRFFHPVKIPVRLSADFWCSYNKTDGDSSKPNDRYKSGDGDKGELEALTDKDSSPNSRTTPITPNHTEDSPEYRDNKVAGDDRRSEGSLAEYNDPAVENKDPVVENEDPVIDEDGNVSGERKPNLDSCVEINGYLETVNVTAPGSSLLQRQDTIPRYQAPSIPSSHSNYGATVPGGAPCAFSNYSAQDTEPINRKRGSTIPGHPLSSSAATVIDKRTEFVPFIASDEEESPPPPPRPPSAISKRDSHKMPLPEPRLSILHTPTGGELQDADGADPIEDSSYLTLVSDLSGSPSILKQTLSPSLLDDSRSSPHTCSTNIVAGDSVVSDDSIVGGEDSTYTPDSSTLNIDSSGVDTPLKNSRKPAGLNSSSSWSPDTPTKDLRNNLTQ